MTSYYTIKIHLDGEFVMVEGNKQYNEGRIEYCDFYLVKKITLLKLKLLCLEPGFYHELVDIY